MGDQIQDQRAMHQAREVFYLIVAPDSEYRYDAGLA